MKKRSFLRLRINTVWLLVALVLLAACAPPANRSTTAPPISDTPAGSITATSPAEKTSTNAPTAAQTATRAPTRTAAATATDSPVVVITPNSLVRRLESIVFAGVAEPLDELAGNDPLSLDPGGLVQTDVTGEAEVVIEGCLSLFIFQDTGLTRSTCRREDAQSGLGFCATGGMVSVINNCTSQVDIQTPSANVTTNGTYFSVIYLPEEQLSIVQLYEGSLDVEAVIDPRSGQTTRPREIGDNTMWFSSPGLDPPSISGVSAREAVPLEAWEAVRGELISRNPNVAKWMAAATNTADVRKLNDFPDFLKTPRGDVQVELIGEGWNNDERREALTAGVPWAFMAQELYPNQETRQQIRWQEGNIKDARSLQFDQPRAAFILGESGYYRTEFPTLLVGVNPENEAAWQYAEELVWYLQNAGFYAELYETGEGGLKELQALAQQRPESGLIWISVSGEAFEVR